MLSQVKDPRRVPLTIVRVTERLRRMAPTERQRKIWQLTRLLESPAQLSQKKMDRLVELMHEFSSELETILALETSSECYGLTVPKRCYAEAEQQPIDAQYAGMERHLQPHKDRGEDERRLGCPWTLTNGLTKLLNQRSEES